MFSKKPPVEPVEEVTLDESIGIPEQGEGNADFSSEQPAIATPRIPSKPSIISEGFEFVGTITSEGTLNIAGVVKGKITAKSVLVDVEGLVEGELNADLLMVKGKVTGDVKCQDLNVGPRALVDGTIAYQNIHIQRGGKVAGKFTKN
ncbi:MAG: bactofilin family protein [Polynucleobacter sp.]